MSERHRFQVLYIGLGVFGDQLPCHNLCDEIFLSLLQADVDNLLNGELILSNSSYPEMRCPFQGFFCYQCKKICCCRV